MTFLVGKILAANPKNRVALIGHYEAQWRPNIAKAQQMVADKLDLPLLRLWEQLGWSQFKPDGTGSPMLNRILTVDGYHPHNQSDGWAVAEIARAIAYWLRDGLPVAGANGSRDETDDTQSDVLAISASSPFTPMMDYFFEDTEGDWSADKGLYAPRGQGIYNITRGRFAVSAIAGAASSELLTHTKISMPADGQAYAIYARSGTNAVDKALFSDVPALERANPNQITTLMTKWGPRSGSRVPIFRLRDAYAPNLLQGGQITAGPAIRSYPDAGASNVKVTDVILTAKGFHYGFASAVNGRAAVGGYFPEGERTNRRLCTIRWHVRSSVANVPGVPSINLWNGAVGPDTNTSLLITTGIVVEQRLSTQITVYRWSGYLPDFILSHFFVSMDMAGTGGSAVITGVQFGFGLDVRRDDFQTDYARNLFPNGRDMEGAGVLIYPGNGVPAEVGVNELKAIGFRRGVLGPVGGRADAGGKFPTDRPVAGNVYTWRFYLGTTSPATWGVPPVIFLWEGNTFLSAETLSAQVVLERDIASQARVYRCTARIPDGVNPTHYYISADQSGSGARTLITGVQFAEGFDIDPEDYPIDTEADPAILAARDAANLQRSAQRKTRTVTWLQTSTALYNVMILDGQSIAAGQETYPAKSKVQYSGNLTLGGASFPAAYAGNTYPTFGLPTLQPFIARVADEGHTTLLNDAQVTFSPLFEYNFSTGTEGWVGTRATVAANNGILTVTATEASPYPMRAGTNFKGSDSRYVRARLRCTSPGPINLLGRLLYRTAGHDYSNSFRGVIADPGFASGEWFVVEWDMANLPTGGTDWTDNIITAIRFDLSAAVLNWEFDWIAFSNTPIGTDYVNKLPAGSSSLLSGYGAFGETPAHGWLNDSKYRLNQMLLTEDDSTRKFVTINGAVSGQGISTFLKPSGSWYGRTLDGLTKVKAAAGASTCAVTAVLWMQGEYDYLQIAGGVNRKATYKTRLNKLFDDYHTDYTAVTGQTKPFAKFLYQSGAGFTVDNDADGNPALAIGMAQLEVAIERNDAFMVGPTYFTTDKGGHLDSNGSRWFGAMAAKVTHKVLHEGQAWEPLRPIRIEQVGRAIYVDFHVPEPPLVWAQPYVFNAATDIADKGFKVTDANGIVPIRDVSLVGQTIVAIILGRATTGQVNVWYAHQSVGGAGMLRDSDPSVSRDLYEYVAGSGDYPAANIPALVGKPYPLQNWGVAFLYPVGLGV